ncbi:hypothetical protein [Nonomuraea sp. NPDC048901]|uniref:hypothetical protein n=1 Tax=Nonomuraea sp. NPDC048901 TaxID=3155627 RepID=UPI0033FE77D2
MAAGIDVVTANSRGPQSLAGFVLAQQLLAALLVKAFNNILAHHIPLLARPAASCPSPAMTPTPRPGPPS